MVKDVKRRMLCGMLLACLTVMPLTACKKDADENNASGTEATPIVTESITVPNVEPLTFSRATKQGGVYMYDIFFENADKVNLTKEYIQLPAGFEADVMIAIDNTADFEKYSIMLSNIQASKGTYTINIQEGAAELNGVPTPAFSFDVDVSDENYSKYVTMSYVTSAAEVQQGGTFTATLTYDGIVDAKFVNDNITEEAFTFYNCTADLALKRSNGNLSICVIMSNITATDVTMPCYVEVAGGVSTDFEGSPINGCKIEFRVVEGEVEE